MAVIELRTFKDIQDMAMEELKVSDSTTRDRIKRDINAVYMNEVVPYDEWEWLEKKFDVKKPAYISAGTISVTNGSTAITFSSAPAESQAGYLFSVDSFREVYVIDSHVAGATAATLKNVFNGTTNASASYKTVREGIPLPVDILDVKKVYHDHYRSQMDNVTEDEMIDLKQNSYFTEGKAAYYSMSDFIDPDPYDTISGFPLSTHRTSSGLVRAITFASNPGAYLEVGDKFKASGGSDDNYNGIYVVEDIDTSNNILYYTGLTELTEATTADSGFTIEEEDRERAAEVYRQLEVYPNYCDEDYLIHVKAVKQISALDDDDDEPEIPLQDRIVLVYGALARAWDRIRNPEQSNKNEAKFTRKLERMAAKVKSKTDFPKIQPSKLYLAGKRLRMSRRRRDFDEF